MKKVLLSIFIAIGFCSCQPILKLVFGKAIEDTEGIKNIKSKHNDDNLIYSTNKQFVYSVYRISENDTLQCYTIRKTDTIGINRLVLKIIPGNFFGQTKIKWEYYDKDSLINTEITGLVEDSTEIWIHPPRFNYPFVFTESAPFPEIRYPLVSGKTWNSVLTIPKGNFKEVGLDGSKVSKNYKITGIENVETKSGNFNNCWKVESFGKSKIGTSKHFYFFNKDYGFVYEIYEFPNKEKLIFELNKN